MLETRDIIIRLLSSIGGRREVSQYLKQYASVERRQFAIVKVGGGLLDEAFDELTSSLSFLQRVGLYPIVIHGAGPQLDRALDEAGLETQRVDGLRVTDAATLDVARRVFQRENLRLVDGLEALGTRARPITSGVFDARLADDARLGFVGEVTHVHLDVIEKTVSAGHLPILTCLGETPGGQIVNLNADVAARELARHLRPFKIVFLTPTGGLLDGNDQVIPSINLTEDYEHLMRQPWLHSGMRLKLREIHQLLEVLPLSSSVSITSASDLPRELFTHRGAGTFVQRGERILEHTSWEGIDRDAFRDLLESCFEKTLAPDYFGAKPVARIYRSESYRATAVLTEEGPVPYLDKFAVTPKAQGEGIGASLWHRMRDDFPKLFWRSRVGNPVNTWYFQQAEGTFKSREWTVFWYGVSDYDEMRACVERALSLPATLTLRQAS